MKKQRITFKRILASVMCLTLFQVNVLAAEEPTKKPPLTYEKAYEMAIKNNSDLNSLVAKMENIQDNREDLFDGTLQYQGSEFLVLDAKRLSYLSSLKSYDNSLKATRIQQEITKVGVSASVKSYFAQIVTLQKGLELSEKSYQVQKQLLIQANLKESLGLISKNDLDTVKRATEKAEQDLKKMQLSLDNAYIDLNKLIGKPAEERYDLDYSVEFEPLKMNASIDMYVNGSLAKDPSLEIQRLAIDSAKFYKNVISDSTTVADYRNAEYEVDNSERAYRDAKLDKEQKIRSTYNKLLELEAERLNLEKALENAKQNLTTVEVNLKVGNATEIQLEQAMLAVEAAEMDLLSNTLTHDITKYSFENTCILS
jgi:outer membrane protein TolC